VRSSSACEACSSASPTTPRSCYLALALEASGHRAEAGDALQRALAVDPQFAGALWKLSGMYVMDNDNEHALRTLERCLAVSPAAASCLRQRAVIHRQLGQCAELEADARRMTVVEPNGPRAYEYLALAIAARGAPVESVRAALEKWMSLTVAVDPSRANKAKALSELELSGFTGDLAAASAAARELGRLVAENPSEAAHAGPTMELIRLLDEQGEPAKALAVAEEFEKRIPAWTADDPDVRIYLVYARHHTRRLGDVEFRHARAALEREVLTRVNPHDAPLVLATFYMAFAETPDEVSDALAHLAEPMSGWASPAIQGLMGRTYLLAGKTDEALPFLRRAAALCGFMPDLEELESGESHRGRLRFHLLLGQALEVKGDKPGACEAYGFILDRWKNAKPRSVTLEKAKERAKALACPR
jgi:tetratricopeptide (TPR) repeat protein